MKKLALLVMLLSGCATVTPLSRHCLNPAPGVRYCLLPPGSLQHLDETMRLVQIETPEKRIDMLHQANFNDNSLNLVASGLLGQPLFALRFSEAEISVRPGHTGIDAVQLITLLQMTYADIDEINQRLEGARISVVANGAQLQRRIEHNGNTVMRIIRNPDGSDEVTIPETGLRLRISPLKTSTR